MPFCDKCGFELKVDDNFCPNCGNENISKGPAKQLSNPYPSPRQQINDPYANNQNYNNNYSQQPIYQNPPPMRPVYNQQFKQPYRYNQYSYGKRAFNAPFDYPLAPFSSRIVAFIIDYIVIVIGLCFCYCPGLAYALFKDGMNNGQSFGKGATNIRVLNFNTGMPASPFESCVRNACNICVCWACIDENQRHVGDLIAGTIVIRDD